MVDGMNVDDVVQYTAATFFDKLDGRIVQVLIQGCKDLPINGIVSI